MLYALQNHAFQCTRDHLNSTLVKLDCKRLALTLKKIEFAMVYFAFCRALFFFYAKGKAVMEFDSSYGPAWHCIVGTSFGSYVTHSLGGFLYFSIDKAYVLLFQTAVKPLGH